MMRMRVRDKITITAVAAFVAVAAFAATPALAMESLWVAQTTTVPGNGKSCMQPGYTTIQSALNHAGVRATVHVCAGTYEEQPQIERAVSLRGSGTPVVKLPSTPAESTGACSKALTAAKPDSPAQDILEVCGTGTVKVSGFTFEGYWPANTCNDNLYGILAGGGVKLKLTSSKVLGAGANPIDGCQGGIGISIGTGEETKEIATAMLSKVTVEGYQKDGIDVLTAGSKAKISHTTVKGAGLTNKIAQNGIEWGEGASATVSRSTVADNSYEGDASSTGIIIFDSAAGAKVTGSTVSNNDVGVWYQESGTRNLKVTSDKFVGDTELGLFLLEGNATVNNDTFNGGEDGIGLYQFKGEASGPMGTGMGDKIENMSSYAIIGYSDNEAGDPPGKFTITKSKISNNPPGASVQHSVFSESSTLQIITTPSDS